MNISSAPGISTYSPQKAAGLFPAASSWLPSSSLPVAKASDLVSLSDAGKSAARLDMLSNRVDDLQSGAVDTAQNFLGQFARQLLGDDAKGAKFSFDSVSVSAQSSYSTAAISSSNQNGSMSAAAMRLDDSASFSGKGTITTADGRTFSFEIEMRYESSAEAASATTLSKAPGDTPPASGDAPATAKDTAPDNPKDMTINFPGTVADLFKMFSQNLLQSSFEVPAKDKPVDGQDNAQGKQGTLRLRLLDLLQQPDSRDARQKKLDKAYEDVTPTNIVKEAS